MGNTTNNFVDYLFWKKEDISETIFNKARACRADYQAVTHAGARKNKYQWENIIHLATEGSCTVWGFEKRIDSKTAALINGFNAHSLELDDGQRFAMIHLGACIISAVNAAWDEHKFTEKQYLIGIILGYEAACRMSIAMQPSHKQLGYHSSGTCGTIGAAVGVAMALSMDKNQLKRVVSLAAGSAAGMLEMQEQKSEVKPYNVGRAAMDGLTSAYMGWSDFDVPDDMIGGERGFLKTFSESFDVEKLIVETDYFEIERIYVKPYASCRHSHSAVEAAIKLHNEIAVEDIESVVVKTYKLGVKGHDHRLIEGVASAKLSTPYAVAAGLLRGRADLTVFEPLDNSVIQLASHISVEEDQELTAESPSKRIAIVIVTKKDGCKVSSRVDFAKGDPENPMTDEEVQEKTSLLANYMNC